MHTPSHGPFRYLWLLALASLAVPGQTGNYFISTLGGSREFLPGAAASAAHLGYLEGVAVDAAGNVYIADAPYDRVFRVRANGTIEPFAGNGNGGFSGDGRAAVDAEIDSPYGLAADGAGNVYIADYDNGRVRRVGADGIISTVAGGGSTVPSFFGAPVRGTLARLRGPRNLALDAVGNLYITEYLSHRVLRLSPEGVLTHVAGAAQAGNAGDPATAALAPLNQPTALAFDRAGALYIADSGNRTIRRVFNGVTTRVTSTGLAAAGLTFEFVTGLAIDSSGELYVAQGRERGIVKISPQGAVTRFATGGSDLTVDAQGNVFIADGPYLRFTNRVTSMILAGTGGARFYGDGGPVGQARFSSPSGVTVDAQGNIYIADTWNHRVRRVGVDGNIQTIAGTGTATPLTPVGRSALDTNLNLPTAVAFDSEGAMWVADSGHKRLVRILPGGQVQRAIATDGAVDGLVIDRAGTLYFSIAEKHNVYRHTAAAGTVRFAGRDRAANDGDGLPPAQASLNRPTGLALDAGGVLYIADTGNARIRRVAPNGVMQGYPSTGLREPAGLIHTGEGLLVSDIVAQRVAFLSPNGSRVELAGDGTAGFAGDGGLATQGKLRRPLALALAPNGSILVADTDNHALRLLSKQAPGNVIVGEARNPGGLLSSASRREAPVVPGALMTITGAGLGPAQGIAGYPGASGRLDLRLEGVEVRFDGLPAPLLYAQDAEIRLQVPHAMHGRARAVVEVWWQGVMKQRLNATVEDVAPRLFTLEGTGGQLQAVNENGDLNTPASRAAAGTLVTLFATGSGLWDQDWDDGRPAPGDPVLKPRPQVEVEIGGRAAEIVWLGAAPGQIGTLQLNVRLPEGVTGEAVPVLLRVGRADSVERAVLAIE